MENKRGRALNPTNLKDYFDTLTEIEAHRHIKPKYKFAMDESPIMIGRSGGRQRVIGPVGQSQQAQLQGYNRESLSIVATICTDGSLPMKASCCSTSMKAEFWKHCKVSRPRTSIFGATTIPNY